MERTAAGEQAVERRLVLVKGGVRRAEERSVVPQPGNAALPVLREGSTGRFVAVIPKVWAVAEPVAVVEPDAQIGEHRAKLQSVEPELAFYRKYTEAMLRRYQRLVKLNGRASSLLGRELFRGDATHSTMQSFDEVVIFCIDIEKCICKLQPFERALLKRIAMQAYTQGETAVRMGVSLRHCVQRYGEALDRLTAILLEARMLDPAKCCQGGQANRNTLSL